MRHIQPSEHSLLHQALATALATMTVFTTLPAWAAPQGEQVVSGSASFARDGVLTQITAGNNAIISYNSFDIAAGETVQFIQPDAAARVLNRIGDAHPTQIDGSLLANGRVYLVNAAGVYFGSGAVVDVGALYAAAGAMSDADFLARRDRFSALGGSVVNLGSIRGDVVSLLGAEVANRGSIASPGGLIALIAGNEVVLVPVGERVRVRVAGGPANGATTPGVLNAGSLDAGAGEVQLAAGDFYSLAIQQSDTGTIRAASTRIEGQGGGTVAVSGAIDATGGTGGSVAVLGEHVRLANALLDASGTNGGGSILVGGDYQGAAGTRTSQSTTIARDTELRADAIASGDGGKVVVWSDGDTRFSGSISARGGALGGNGGIAETSGKQNLAFDGAVDLGAPNGAVGSLLLDPQDIDIVDAAPSPDDGQVGPGDGTIARNDGGLGNNFTISKTALESVTGNISLQASRDITVSGANTLDLANQTSGETITFNAEDDITISSAITTGGGTLILQSNSDAANGGDIAINSAITTNGGGVTLLGLENGGNNNGGDVVVGAAVSTGGGNFQSTHNRFALSLAGSIATGAGDVTLAGARFATITGAITGDALTIDAGTTVALPALSSLGSLDVTGPGGITLNGDIATSGGQRFQSPVVLAANRTLSSSANGDVRFDGSVDSDNAQNRNLSVNTGGATTFAGNVGAADALGTLTTDDAGSLAISANVTTVGGQSYADDALSIAGTLTDTGTGIDLGDEASDALAITGATVVDVSGSSAVSYTLDNATTLGGDLEIDTGSKALTISGTVDDDGAGGTSSDLRLTSGGATTVNAAIGGASAVESVFSNGGATGSLAINADVTTTGGQAYNDPTIALGAVTLTDTGAGSIVMGTAAGNDALAVNGAATLVNSGGGSLDLNTVTTLAADLTLDGSAGDVTVANTIDGAQDLALNSTGDVTVDAEIGGTTALTTVTSDDGGTIDLNQSVSTTGGQIYNDSTISIASSTLTTTTGGITIGNAASDTVTFTGGGPTTTINTSAANGQIALNASATLGRNLVLSSGTADLAIAGNLKDDGSGATSSDLTLNSTGLTTISGSLGGTTNAERLESVTTNVGGSLLLSGTVRTSAGQDYNEAAAVTLGSGAGANTLSDTSANGIQFAAAALTAAGNTTLSTSGAALNLTQAITLAGDLSLDSGSNNLTLSGAVDDDGNGATSSDLALNGTGTTTIATAVGATNAIESLTSDDGGTVNVNAAVTTSAGQTYNDSTISIATATLSATSGDITIGNAASDTVSFGGVGTATVDTSAGNGQIALNASATLARDLVLTSGSGDLTLAGDLKDDGSALTSSDLALNSTGATTISGNLGGATTADRIESVTTNAGGTLVLSGTVRTNAGQFYNETPSVTLGSTAGANTLSDTSASFIQFAATDLVAAGDTTLSSAGGVAAIDLTKATTLVGDLTLDGGANAVTVSGAVNGDGSPATSSGLTLTSDGVATIATAIGATTAAGSVTTTGAGSLAINANVSTANGQAYETDGGITLAGVTLADTGAGTIRLGNSGADTLTVSGAASVSNSGGGSIDLNATTTLGAGLTLSGNTNGVTIDGTVDGAQALALNGAGTVAINAALGGTTALASVVSDDGGTADINAAVTTSGGQSWNDSTIQLGATLSDTGAIGIALGNAPTDALAISAASTVTTAAGTGDVDVNAATTLGNNTLTLSSGANDIALDGSVDGAGALALNSTGTVNVNAAIGAGTAVTSVSSDDGGTIDIASNVTTTGGQTYDDATISLNGGALTDTGAGSIAIGNAAADALSVAAASVVTNGGGGTLSLNATTTLGADLTLDAGAGALNIGVAIDDDGNAGTSSDLALNSTGTTTISSAIGATNAIESLTSDDGGTVNIASGATIATSAGQTYNDTTIDIAAPTLTSTGGGITIGNAATDTVLFSGATTIDTSAGNGQIALNASATLGADLSLSSGTADLTVAGNLRDDGNALTSSDLALNSGGATTISGNLGGSTNAERLESVSTSAGGSLAVTGTVRTSAGQLYNETGSATIGSSAGANTLSDTSATGIQFAAANLTADGDTTLSTAGGTAAIDLTQTTTLAGDLSLDGGANAVTVSGAVDDDGNAATSSELVLNSSGTTTIGAAIGGGSAIESATTDGAGTLAINAAVTTTGGQSYADSAIALGAVMLSDSGAGSIALGDANTDALAVNGAASVANTGGGAIDLNAATTLSANLTLDGGAGDISVDGTVNGGAALALNSTGTVNVNAALGGTTALASLTSDDGGTLNVNAAVATTGDLSLADSTIDLGVSSLATTGAGSIAIGNASTDTVQFSGATTLDTSAGTGDIAVNASATLSADLALNAGANDISLAGNIEDDGSNATSADLALNSTGATTISGTIGAANRVESVTTNAGGSLALNADVATRAGQAYQDAAITVGGPGARVLSDTGAGGIALGAAAGTVAVNADTTLRTSGGTGDVTLAGATTLGANLTLETGANDAIFGGTIADDGNAGSSSDVLVNSSGATTVSGAVTAESLTTDDAGTLALNANVTTTGGQSYAEDAIQLAAALSDTGTVGIQLGDGDAGDTLTVTGASSVSATGGDNLLALDAATTLAGNLTLDAGANALTLDVAIDDDNSAATSGDLVVNARTLLIDANIGDTRPVESLVMNLVPAGGNLLPTDVIEFDHADAIHTTGLLSFNPGGRGSAPDATIFKTARYTSENLDLTLASSGGDVRFGQGEKLTVAGDIAISAGGTVAVSDINGVAVSLTAGSAIVIVGRQPGLTSNGDPDVGADIVADSLTLDAQSLTVSGPQGFVRFGLPNGGTQGELVDVNGLLGSPFVAIAAFEQASVGITQIDLVDPVTGVAIDFTPGGPAPGSQRPPANPVAVLLQKPSGGVNIAAASERPLRESEVSAFLSCDLEDIECQAKAVGEARANSAEAQELREAFTDLFGPTSEVDTTALAIANDDPQKAVLDLAVRAYRSQTGQPPTGVAFRQFCQSSEEHANALRVLDDLRDLFTSARDFGMTGEGIGDFKQQTLQAVAPEGIGIDALDAAVEAGAVNP